MNKQIIVDYFSEPYSNKKINNIAFKMNFLLNSSIISFLCIIFSIISFYLIDDVIYQYISITGVFCFSIMTFYLFRLSMKFVNSVIYSFPISPNIILKKYIDIDLVNSNNETKNFYNKIVNERDMYVFEYNLIKDFLIINK